MALVAGAAAAALAAAAAVMAGAVATAAVVVRVVGTGVQGWWKRLLLAQSRWALWCDVRAC
eukprot:12062025-Alexandrium_andersonii.AAC.1